jgi:type II secretory pathway pseudopilin PulG
MCMYNPIKGSQIKLRNDFGFSMIEILVVSGIMMVVLFATSSLMISQFSQTEYLSQKLAVLDLEKFLILNSAGGDICAREVALNAATYTFPTASFPPSAAVLLQRPVDVPNLYQSAASPQLLATVGQAVAGTGKFKIERMSLSNFGGVPGSYIATLDISFTGSIQPIKSLHLGLKLATSVAGANTIITGCPGLNAGGTIPLTNFIPYTANNAFTVPPGVSAILVEAWGGGGGGGGSAFYLKLNPPDAGAYAGGGGGGGGGGYGKTIISVVPGQVFNIVVGAGGVAGIGAGLSSGNVFASNGGNGGDSSFGGAILIAKGGLGGSRTNVFPAVASVGQGGTGKGSLGAGVIYTAFGGSGGNASFNYSDSTMATGSSGGSAGGGGGGGGGTMAPGSAPGGAGGGGSKFNDAIGAYPGAPGARGQVNVWW